MLGLLRENNLLGRATSKYLLIGVGLILPLVEVLAADLYIAPQTKKVNIGDNFSVILYVDSPDQAMNAVSFRISYPTNLLKINSISKSGTIINLWVQEPNFYNGEIIGEGVVLNPGFTGTKGNIITINLKALNPGTAELKFVSGSVLANDGLGTNILKNLYGAKIDILSREKIEEKEETLTSYILPKPQITSPTHPDQEKWYNLKDVKLLWELPSNVTEVKTLLGQKIDVIPQVSYIPPISSKEITIPYDGIWYFSLQFCNNQGCSSVARYKLKIDTTPPEVNIKEIERQDLSNPQVKIYIDSKDNLSGISYYLISLNGAEEKWYDDGSHIYEVKNAKIGENEIIVKAFDKAGNYSEAKLKFLVNPLEAPIINYYTKEINQGDIFIVKGKSKYIKSYAILELFDSKGIKYTAKSEVDESGNFEIKIENLPSGNYKGYVYIIDQQERKSKPSSEIYVNVEIPVFIKLLGLALILLIIILGLIIVVVYYIIKINKIRENIEKELEEMHKKVESFISYLSNKFEEQIKILNETKNKRELTEEENKILHELENKLIQFKKYLHKELKNLEDIIEK